MVIFLFFSGGFLMTSQSTISTVSTKSGAYALLDSLFRHGVKFIFGYPGGAILHIYDELYRWEELGLIKHILVRHEQAAAHAADAYARSTGLVGVCFATSGPGATNLVSGIATAQMDSVPIVFITGQVSRDVIGTDAFQEVDIFGITMPIVKHSFVVRHAKDMAKTVANAFYIAKHGRPGPVLIDVPKDVGIENFSYNPVQPSQVFLPGCRPLPTCHEDQIVQAIKMIQKSNQPLLYVGGGSIISEAYSVIRELVDHCQIPLTTTLMGKGILDENHRLSLGMLGMHGTAYANYAVSECDLLIALGTRFDDRVTGKLEEFACNAQVIHVDIDSAEISKNRVAQVAIVGDVKQIISRLLDRVSTIQNNWGSRTKPWLNRIAKWKQQYPLLIPSSDLKLYPQEVICKLNETGVHTFYTTDVGQHQMWAAQFVKVLPRHWMSSAGLGTMGYGLPAAIGTQIAHPSEKVICITGDASFLMNIQELGTVSQYNLPIIIVIINNHWQGMVRQWQQAFHNERYSHSDMSKGSPNFQALAQSFGIQGYVIRTRSEMSYVFSKIQTYKGPLLLDFHVTENENCYPMVAPGKSNNQMIGVTKEKSITSKLKLQALNEN